MADTWIAPPKWPNPPPPLMPNTTGTQPITVSTVATIPQLPNPVWPPPYVPPPTDDSQPPQTQDADLARMSDNGREPPPPTDHDETLIERVTRVARGKGKNGKRR